MLSPLAVVTCFVAHSESAKAIIKNDDEDIYTMPLQVELANEEEEHGKNMSAKAA